MNNSEIECIYCGPTPVSHIGEWSGAVLLKWMRPLVKPVFFTYRSIYPILSLLPTQYGLLGLFKALEAAGLIVITDRIHPAMSDRTKVIWKAAEERGIKMRALLFQGRPSDVLIANHKNGLMIFDALPRPEGKITDASDWMDNKGLLRKHFTKAGVPMAKGGMFWSQKKALDVFRKLEKPVIVKPAEGSRSRHTTINIETEQQLKEAIRIAKQLSPWFILEEQLVGMVYRATVIGGKVVGVMRREPPHVIGDGASSVKQLVDEENKNPLRMGPVFHQLDTGPEAVAELERQQLTFESIPFKDQLVTLHPKVGRSSGASNRDVTDITHPDNIQLFERVGEVLKDDLVGIDFIIEDITKSYKEQTRFGVIECNSLPFIDLHHYPLYGEVRDAAGALWDTVLKK